VGRSTRLAHAPLPSPIHTGGGVLFSRICGPLSCQPRALSRSASAALRRCRGPKRQTRRRRASPRRRSTSWTCSSRSTTRSAPCRKSRPCCTRMGASRPLAIRCARIAPPAVADGARRPTGRSVGRALRGYSEYSHRGTYFRPPSRLCSRGSAQAAAGARARVRGAARPHEARLHAERLSLSRPNASAAFLARRAQPRRAARVRASARGAAAKASALSCATLCEGRTRTRAPSFAAALGIEKLALVRRCKAAVLDAAHVMIAAVVTPAAAPDGPAATPSLTAEQSGSWRARCMRAHKRARARTLRRHRLHRAALPLAICPSL
jgi:hypothetical protein